MATDEGRGVPDHAGAVSYADERAEYRQHDQAGHAKVSGMSKTEKIFGPTEMAEITS